MSREEVSLFLPDYQPYYSLKDALESKDDYQLDSFVMMSENSLNKIDTTLEKLKDFVVQLEKAKTQVEEDLKVARTELEGIKNIEYFYEGVVEVENTHRYVERWSSRTKAFVQVRYIKYKKKRITFADDTVSVVDAYREDDYKLVLRVEEFPWAERKKATELSKEWSKEYKTEIVKKK